MCDVIAWNFLRVGFRITVECFGLFQYRFKLKWVFGLLKSGSLLRMDYILATDESLLHVD